MTAKNVEPSQHTIPVVPAWGKPEPSICVVSRERFLALVDVFWAPYITSIVQIERSTPSIGSNGGDQRSSPAGAAECGAATRPRVNGTSIGTFLR